MFGKNTQMTREGGGGKKLGDERCDQGANTERMGDI